MVELLRHRQTKEAATDMFSLKPPRHIPTLPAADVAGFAGRGQVSEVERTRSGQDAKSAVDPERTSPQGRLMGLDEAGTARTLHEHRAAVPPQSATKAAWPCRRVDRIGAPAASWCDPAGVSPA